MMRIRHVKTVSTLLSIQHFMLILRKAVKSGIANMTVQNNAISRPISSVVSVVMQATWLEIVQIDNVELIGAMGLPLELRLVALLLVALVAVMLSTVNMR